MSLTARMEDRFENLTIGISRCFQKHVQHQWGNESTTGMFHVKHKHYVPIFYTYKLTNGPI